MFRCKSIAELMMWRATHSSIDDTLRVPSDCAAWKHINSTWLNSARKPRNLHLGVAMDGVNSFGLPSTSWSTWLVVFVNYNIPPWLTIKKGHLILALLVTGKYKAKNMNVYMAVVMEELQTL